MRVAIGVVSHCFAILTSRFRALAPLALKRACFVLLGGFLCLLSAPRGRGQIANINNDQATPIHGVGHDYIKMLSETVSPASGQVSLRIDFPIPQARKMSVPYAWLYNSSGIHHVGPYQDGIAAWWTDIGAVAGSGWMDSSPLLTAIKGQTVVHNPNGNPPVDYTCTFISNYIFQDLAASRHSLNLSIGQTTDGGTHCNLGDIPQISTAGGDDFVAAGTTQVTGGGIPTIPTPVRVAGPDGTSYYFSSFSFAGLSPNVSAFSAFPTSVTDRNGNQLQWSSSVSGTTITDDAGHAAILNSPISGSTSAVTVSGIPSPFTLHWASYPANFNTSYVQIQQPNGKCGSLSAYNQASSNIQTLTLPNGQSFQFQYDSVYGLLSKIIYPGGGYVSYTWGVNALSEAITVPNAVGQSPSICSIRYGVPAITHRYVSFDGTTIAQQQDFTYSTTWSTTPGTTWTNKQTTVTTKDLLRATNYQTIYNYIPVTTFGAPNVDNSAGQAALESSIVDKDFSGSTLRTVTKGWIDQYLLNCELITLDTGSISGTWYQYNGGAYVPAKGAPLTDKREYNYGIITSTGGCTSNRSGVPPPSATPTREVVMNYAAFTATPSYPSTLSIFDRPSQILTYDNGTLLAETDYAYDGSTVSAVTPGPLSHDSAYNSAYNNRGNATTKTVKCLQTGCSNSISKYTFDETGQVLTFVDPCGNVTCTDMTGTNHTTSYSHTDSFASGTGTPAGNTNAFVTQVTHPNTGAAHVDKFTYGYSDGQVRTSIDQNNQTTTYQYADSLARSTKVIFPDTGNVTYSYNDAPPTPSVTAVRTITATQSQTTTNAMDGLGQIVQTQGSDTPGTDLTDITFDATNNVWKRSNAHRSTASPTDGTTTFVYDSLGRVTKMIPPDGTTTSDNVTTTYTGNCATVSDEAGKARKSCSDSLGRLIQVFEDPNNSAFETDYTYDALDNLLTVNQKGGSSVSSNWRTRTFTYDSLSRLLTAANPESGTITYSYDVNGNLKTKVAPAPNQTGATTVTTTYTYDTLNRVTQKSFSDSTATVKYGYDAIAPASCTLPTLTIHNGIGKRTGMCDAGGAEAWSNDITAGVGWKTTDVRTTAGITKTSAVQNNFDGSVAALTYPSGRVLNYTYNTATRPVSAIDPTGPINYATSASYAPPGGLASVQNGANVISTLYYDKRVQPCRISVKSSGTAPGSCADSASIGNVLDFTYNFNLGTTDNGNMYGITNNRDTARNQTFGYDSLNRIATAQTTSTFATSPRNCWGEAFFYDNLTVPGGAWGNLTKIQPVSTAYTGCTQESLSTTATTNNQISGFCYDAAGNLLAQSAPPCPSPTYTYNAENQMTLTAGVTYTYDGDGKRVKKSNGKLYWYGMGNDPLDETDLTGVPTNSAFKEYIFFGGKRIARRDSTNAVNYYFADHLGTARIVASATGTVLDDSDFYPFGGERVYLNSSPQAYKFTGKERDSESGLDNFGARYDSSSMGRFMSPDPILSTPVHIINPQRWNKYDYAVNNPLSYIDPAGRDAIAVTFRKEVPIGGHEGIISVHSDGSATYARFGPKTPNTSSGEGSVKSMGLKTKIQFGKDGLPTTDSYEAVAKEVAGIEDHQDPGTVRMNYFKTSDADTAALDAWIQRMQEASNHGKAPFYDVAGQNCAAFCIAGLVQANAIQNKNISLIPNRLFNLLSPRANENYPLREKVTFKICSGDADNRKCQ